ncbi:P-loop containing nucleoside triphosphate hydrolase protein [Pseudomassariella vexata]|uniref:p-loop containing nucleoside triphosphate hydrolase protein n=1 Tax=Pseudomassariella vexata TaxID=1141098 RepID=A0A1Y2EA60_9PEZI|nr:P-loop containing nucleoside triphosphate hydrolase protein [Pseudomassariella vexata]ORY68287.1 P-loop containing nucleoside triphosphate hydrolase protein [Pseudomassariella vexata]
MDKPEHASSVSKSMDHAGRQEPERRLSLSAAGRISLDDVEPVDVQLRDLAVTVDTSPSILDPVTYPEIFRNSVGKGENGPTSKSLLRSVNASLPSSTLTAILGGSGSGKTTLLNTIAERIFSTRLSQTGTATFNGFEGVHSIRHAYVMQQDILLPTLTVRETLRYSANLRLPPPTTEEERMRIVEEVILELGLKDCADTRIGNSQHRGCSGGEKRRTTIGVQLLANPSVLFLDEPTTGLDAASAYQVVRTLKALANKGRTIIFTVHQPRSEIWDLFDNLILLSKGSPVYSGQLKDCMPWFAEMGFELPPFVNPAEFFVDHAAVDNRTPELEAETTERVNRLKAAWDEKASRVFEPLRIGSTANSQAPKKPKQEQHAGFFRQLRVLTDRTLKVTFRDPMGMAGSIFEAILMALITGYIFYALPRDQSGIRSRQAALYTSVGLQGYLFLMFETYRLTIDIPTFDREHSEGCVTPMPFILSRRIARLFTEDVPVPFLYSVIYYFMVGFDPYVGKFFTFFSIVLLNHYIAVTLAMTAVAAVRHFPGASLIGNLAYTLQSMACGFFVQSNTIPVYVRWLKYCTYTYYAFGALCGNEFEGSFYDCPLEGGESNPACVSYTGAYIMKNLGFPKDWTMKPILAMVGFVILFWVLSWVGLAFLKVEVTIARARNSDTDLSAGKEKMTARSIHEVRTIDVGLDKFALALDKRSTMGRKLPTKTILNPVTATFHAGQLNIIMGPSGSGKTSLLNAMALRLKNSLGTQYRPAGKLTFNGAVPSDSVIRSVVSYVCQDDDALLPSLTVRETLRFAAGLRLPSWMSKQQKYERAEEVLLNMGLKDCADNLVGSDLVKGISGGEKRRVSIAVQILTDPRVLLLDEPTSGLDAFTASSILEVLHGLAKEGRTLILTIHQARSDIFKHFGIVLLLARGGSPAYAGKAKDMIRYFGGLGYPCPHHVNPADHALDLITVDLQEEQREAESREKVERLVRCWADTAEQSPAEVSQATARLSNIDETEELKNEKTTRRVADVEGATDSSAAPEQSSAGHAVQSEKTNPEGGVLQTSPPAAPITRTSFNKKTLATPAELGAMVHKRASFLIAVPILLHRAIINFRRQPPLLLARTMQVVGLGVILTLFFAPLHNDYPSIQNRVGFVQEMGAFYFVGMLQNVAVYPAEREVFYREDDDVVYSAEAFLATYTMLEVPFEIITCLVFGVLADLAVGFPRTVEMYFICAFSCFGIVSCGESLGIMFNTVFNHTGFAVNIISILLSVAQIMAGVMSIDMPQLFKAFNYLSPAKYATAAFAHYTLTGIRFTCDREQSLPNGECIIATGEQVLDLYKLDVNGKVNIAALAATVVVYRLVAWGLLRAVRTKWKGIGRRKEVGSGTGEM